MNNEASGPLFSHTRALKSCLFSSDSSKNHVTKYLTTENWTNKLVQIPPIKYLPKLIKVRLQ